MVLAQGARPGRYWKFSSLQGSAADYHPGMTSIVMADDHAIVRAGFRALIEQTPGYTIAAECASVDETWGAVGRHGPDIVVLDISLPGGGLNLVPRLCHAYPDTRVLILSMHAGEPYVSEALRCGASGYVSKGAAADELVTALDALREGRSYFSSDLRRATWGPSDSAISQLSEREHEVFLLFARGQTPKQVAGDLGISVKTAYLHRTSIRGKLGLRNDLDLHRVALSHGLLHENDPPGSGSQG